jgi:hypothetical protein
LDDSFFSTPPTIFWAEYGDLLLAPTDIGTYELVELVEDLCGICYPAHIDRASNSVISNLGIFPDDLGVGLEPCSGSQFRVFWSLTESLTPKRL